MADKTRRGSIVGRAVTRRAALRTAAVAGGGLAAAMAVRGRAVAQQGMPQGPQQVAALTRLAADAFMWTYNGYNMLIVVTDEGVIGTDPSSQMSAAGAMLYQAVIRSITDKPVKYIVYSHDHADHNTGGDLFAGTAEFVAHRLAAPKIAARNDPRSPVPAILVDDFMTLELGGKQIELWYTGRNHSDNSLVLRYPARRLAYAVDFIPVRSVPFRTLGDSYPDEWVDSLQFVIDKLDFDLLVPGHGALGSKDNAREVRQYFLDLMAAVRAAREQGLPDNSMEMVGLARERLMPRYGSWGQFGPWLSENIEGLVTTGFTK